MPSILFKRWLGELCLGLIGSLFLFYFFVDFISSLLPLTEAIAVSTVVAILVSLLAIRHYRYRWQQYLQVVKVSGLKIQQAQSYSRIGKPEEAIALLLPIAKMGISKAQFQLGKLYLKSKGDNQDYAAAHKWLQRCAKLEPQAHDLLGSIFQYGLGQKQDYEKALKHFEIAANFDVAAAACHLGFMLMIGFGTYPSAQKAKYWLLKSAKQGHIPAQNHLGFLYYYGHGVLQEDEKRRTRSSKGLNKNSKATEQLDFLYDEATLPQNYQKAFHWYQRSAMKGNQHAQYYLGLMYEFGQGVPIDERQAEYWYLKAAEQQDKDAIDAFNELYDDQHRIFDEENIALIIQQFQFRDVMKICPNCGQKIHLKIPLASLVTTCVHCQHRCKVKQEKGKIQLLSVKRAKNAVKRVVIACAHCQQKMRTVKPKKPRVLVCVNCKKRSQVFLTKDGNIVVRAWRVHKKESPKPKQQHVVDPKPWYDTLGLPVGAPLEAIKKSRKRMMQKVHPDKVAHLDYEYRAQAEESSKKINAAYKNLVTYLESK